MMNLFKLSETLKDFSKDQLVREMQMPSGNVPQYLVMSELQRRTRMEKEAATAEPPSQTTVAQDTVTAAGMPQGGVAQMAQALAPKTDMAANTGIAAMQPQAAPTQRMQEGGVVRMQAGTAVGPNTTTYQDWLGMSRTERERAGLPTSTIGGQLYFNRFGVGLGLNDPETGAPYGRRPTSSFGSREVRSPDDARYDPLPSSTSVPDAASLMADARRRLENAGISSEQIDDWLAAGVDLNYPLAQLPIGDAPADIEATRPENPFAEATAAAERAFGPLEPPAGMTPRPLAESRAALLPPPREFDGDGEPGADTETPGMDTGTPLTGAAEDLLPPGAGGAGGPGGAGDLFGGLDSDYETDKWLALARFGLGLMSSREPTLGGAIGEAGAGALDSLSAARESFRDRQMQQAELDLARQRLALEAAGGDSRGIGARDLLGAYREQLGNIDTQLAELSTYMVGEEVPPAIAQQYTTLTNQRARVAGALTALGASGFGPATQRLVETDLTQ